MKPDFLRDYRENAVGYGVPIYEFKKSLQAKRFFPPEEYDEQMAHFINDNGGINFFKNKKWKIELESKFEKIIKEKPSQKGYFETDEEHYLRIFQELKESKNIIENKLNKTVNFLCWPGGSYTELGHKIALDAGYKATSKGYILNIPGHAPSYIFRISSWFGGNYPKWFKWLLFKGNIDRATGKKTIIGIFIQMLRKLIP